MTSENKKTWLWLVAILLAAAGLLAVAFLPANGPRWEALRNRTTKLKRDAMTRKSPRTVLRGKPVPGNAWDEYNIALNAPWPKDAQNGGIFYQFASGQPGVNGDRVKEMVVEQEPLLDHLRRAAQRSDGQYPYNWDAGLPDSPSLLRSRMLANLALAKAKMLTDDGKAQEAAELLLDVTAFGRDLSTNTTLLMDLVGVAVYQVSFEGLRNLVLSGKLTRAQLEDLAKKLETVERDIPSLDSTFSNEILGTGTAILQMQAGDDRGWRERAKAGGWRFAAFPQSTMLEAFEENDLFMDRYNKADQKDFSAAKRAMDAIAAEVAASPNPIVREFIPGMSRVVEVHRERLTMLRLVRAAALFRATGKTPAIEDPFGASLFFKEESGKARIWSVGPDGKNQNGVGNFDRGGPDMVLEIPK
jgi:hypothetical protein